MQDSDISQTDQYLNYVFSAAIGSHDSHSVNEHESTSPTLKAYTVYVTQKTSNGSQLSSEQTDKVALTLQASKKLFEICVPKSIIVDSANIEQKIAQIDNITCNETILCGAYQGQYQDTMETITGWWAHIPTAMLTDCSKLMLVCQYAAGNRLFALGMQDFVDVPKMSDIQVSFGQYVSKGTQNKILSWYCMQPETLKVSPSLTESEIRWQSQLELKYRISTCLNRHVYSRTPSAASHHCLVLNNQTTVHVFNRELMIYNMITYYVRKDCSVQVFMSWLCQIRGNSRLRYPLTYYTEIYSRCAVIVSKTQMNTNNLNSLDYIKLIKYTMIECIDVAEVIDWLSFINQQEPCEDNGGEGKQVSVIRQLPWNELKDDPVDNTLIFYWILGFVGCSSSAIYAEIQEQIESCCAQSIIITQSQEEEGSVHEAISSFVLRADLFQFERLAYIMLDVGFNTFRLNQILALIENVLSPQVHYEFYLVAPKCQEREQEQEFQLTEQIDSYFFSFDYILCAILNTQRDKNQFIAGRSLTNLAKILHYISKTYSNLSLDRLSQTDNYNRNITAIRYSLTDSYLMSKQSMGILEKQEVNDCLRVLLDASYKEVVEEDSLLYYFLETIEQIEEYHWDMQGVADQIVCSTFSILPYIDFQRFDK